ncbi:GtrA family protein [Wenjunlia tyrosinilytica]|nr:GtrA family protein [Wenjunlia tyrosinilytica]
MSALRRLYLKLRLIAAELMKFGAVGAFGVVVNIVVFNLCLHSLKLQTVRSGVIATIVAIATNYVGNRYWTYRNCDKNRRTREITLFLLFSGIGLVIENGILALSHYGFGFTSTLADNVAKNVVGLGLGTLFRFWSYRTWVFRALPARDAVDEAERMLTENGGKRPYVGRRP